MSLKKFNSLSASLFLFPDLFLSRPLSLRDEVLKAYLVFKAQDPAFRE